MSIPERLYRISKSYIGQVRDRIDTELAGLDREPDAETLAARELRDALASESEPLPTSSDPDAMMRRAEQRIAALRRDLEMHSTEAARAAQPASPQRAISTPAASAASAEQKTMEADPNFHDYRVLGVPVGGDLATVQAEYEKLARRCDPRRFPEGSPEQKQAEQILGRVYTAYEALRRRLDPTENRFGKLEIE